MQKFAYTLLLVFFVLPLTAQKTRLLRVYVDAFSPIYAPSDLKTQFPFVDYVAKPTQCEVSVFLLVEPVGNDFTRLGLCFLGKERFEGQNDTVWYLFPPLTPEMQQRDKANAAFKRGILPYLRQCNLSGPELEALIGPLPDLVTVPEHWHKTLVNIGGLASIFANTLEYSSARDRIFYAQKQRQAVLNGNIKAVHFEQAWRYGALLNVYHNKTDQKTIDNYIETPIPRVILLSVQKSIPFITMILSPWMMSLQMVDSLAKQHSKASATMYPLRWVTILARAGRMC